MANDVVRIWKEEGLKPNQRYERMTEDTVEANSRIY